MATRRARVDGDAGAVRHVEYTLSDFGRTLRPSLNALASWAKVHHHRAPTSRVR